eukprot:TRINITY_DN31217_c0_g1_i1.p1 TRINITY_DN31217_c0_g1~~TRINITY_DN31217_c0_g1_i1.p1  ORF type:complete len:241 (-),score=16.68 TRINITY_DN31217_c0_g1_i1:201-923(-)
MMALSKLGVLSAIAVGGMAASVHFVLKKRLCARKLSGNMDCDLLGIFAGEWSTLHWLSLHGKARLLKLLFSSDSFSAQCAWWCSLNAMATENRWTPLHCAVTNGHVSVVSSETGSMADVVAKIRESLEGRAPCCSCGSVLKPDVVFYGEPLPAAFTRHSGEGLNSYDLLIVVGTSPNVYPVAGLTSRVSPLVPRLLINNEAVGPWRGSDANPENNSDCLWLGDCDSGAEELARLIGWQLA